MKILVRINIMKRISTQIKYLVFAVFALFLIGGLSSCSKKIGCPVNEQAHGNTKKTKPAKTHLFSKKMRKN